MNQVEEIAIIDTYPVVVVTVTYGQRAHFLIQVLDAARAEGVVGAVVIDNGSVDPVQTILSRRYGNWAFVNSMEENKGSALGFKAGIELALARGAAYLLLLDDDNILSQGCLGRLVSALRNATGDHSQSNLAVFGFRSDHQGALLDRANGSAPLRTVSTFRGFHLLDLPRKILSRIQHKSEKNRHVKPLVAIDWGPYGGMLFHGSLVETIGLPNTSFVLYEDDTEFTYRITKGGGKLWLVTGAEIFDAETSWNVGEARKTSFSILLAGGSDLRAFYSFRNGVYSDFHCRGGNWSMIYLNMAVYLLVLVVFAIFKRRISRLLVLLRALRDGMVARLGVSPEFRL